jgi:hypothetical protein
MSFYGEIFPDNEQSMEDYLNMESRSIDDILEEMYSDPYEDDYIF